MVTSSWNRCLLNDVKDRLHKSFSLHFVKKYCLINSFRRLCQTKISHRRFLFVCQFNMLYKLSHRNTCFNLPYIGQAHFYFTNCPCQITEPGGLLNSAIVSWYQRKFKFLCSKLEIYFCFKFSYSLIVGS